MIHHLQLLINDLWQSFFWFEPDLETNCENYREFRAALRRAGITYPCRLRRARARDNERILSHQEAHPEVVAVFKALGDAKVREGVWNDKRDESDEEGGEPCSE